MNSHLTVQCPACGFTFDADESHIGLSTNCANCSSEFIIKQSEDPSGRESSSSLKRRPDKILVTSANISDPYEVVGMVCFATGTRGEMKNVFESQKNTLKHKIGSGQLSGSNDVGQMVGGLGFDSTGNITLMAQYAGASFQSSDMEIAFHITVNQLQLRASYLKADAVVGFRYDIDFDSNANVVNFMASGYGTAVRLIK